MTLSRPLRINWLIVGINAFQGVAAAERPATAKENGNLSRRPTRIPAEKAVHHTDEVPAVKRVVQRDLASSREFVHCMRPCPPRSPPKRHPRSPRQRR